MALYRVHDEPLEKLAEGLTTTRKVSADLYELMPSPPGLSRYITFVTY